MNLGDFVVVMRAGAIEDVGPPRRVYLKPATEFTATFMGESNLIEGRAVAAGNSGIEVETAFGRMRCEGRSELVGRACRVSIRPEHVKLTNGGDEHHLGRGRVRAVVFQGPRVRCAVERCDVPGGEFVFTGPADTRVSVGDEISLYADPRQAVLLPIVENHRDRSMKLRKETS